MPSQHVGKIWVEVVRDFMSDEVEIEETCYAESGEDRRHFHCSNPPLLNMYSVSKTGRDHENQAALYTVTSARVDVHCNVKTTLACHE